MDTSLDIDFTILENPPATSDMSPHDIAGRFRWLLINPDMNTDMAVRQIHDRYAEQFQNSVKSDIAYRDALIAQRRDLDAKLKQLESENVADIDSKNAQMNAVKQIVALHESLLSKIPESARMVASDNEIIAPDAWIKRVVQRLGFFEKIKFDRANAQKDYSELVRQCSAVGLAVIPDEKTLERINKNIAHSAAKNNNNINEMRSNIAKINQAIEHFSSMVDTARVEYSNKMNDDIKRFMSVFHEDARRRTQLQKIPPFINMQGLNQPVAFFQNIDAHNMPENYINQISELLRRAGLTVAVGTDAVGVSNPGTYVLRRSAREKGYIELITPFFTPESARTDVSAVLKYLASHGVEFVGAVHPATQSQIDPRGNVPRADNPDEIADIIRNKLRGAMSRDDFATDAYGKYLFRGHNFITDDTKSSYATPTWRSGRSGLAYATDDANYAYGYSGGARLDAMAGETITPQSLHSSDGDIPVGFLTVYRRNAKNIMVDNLDLESMETHAHGAFKRIVNRKHMKPETVVSPTNNPVVARYLVSGDRIVQIDDNDSEWRRVMNYFAPDLSITHTGDYGRAFIRRLDNIRGEMQSNDGAVKTYDIPNEKLANMVLSKEELLELGRHRVQKMNRAKNMDMHIASNTTQME